jgi:tripartite-type tricarboxylate transporter receptor subunit TctC
MRKRQPGFGLLASTVVALSMFASQALAQAWPAKPVRIIISQPPGTAPDIITRLLSDHLAKGLNQAIVVDNRPGAQNIVGAQAAASSAPDGYTFFVATAAALVTNPLTVKTLPYDPAKQFAPVSMVGQGPFLLVANSKVAAANLTELAALDKAQPGKLRLANEGPKSFGGMVSAYLNKVAGTQLLLVPYNVNTQGLQDTVGGTTDLSMQAVPAVAALLKNGTLKGLAVTSAKRLPGLEQIPTVGETYAGFELTGWFVMVAPTGTPADIVQRMNMEMDRALRMPAVQARMNELGIFSEGAGTPATVQSFINTERDTWTKLVRELGIQAE